MAKLMAGQPSQTGKSSNTQAKQKGGRKGGQQKGSHPPNEMMQLLQPALFAPKPEPTPAQSKQPPNQAIQVPPPKPIEQLSQPASTQNQGARVAGAAPPPPPPLMGTGQTFNPGQFFNMFEGVNMQMGPPPGGRGPPPAPAPLGAIPRPPAPLGFPMAAGFQQHPMQPGRPQQQIPQPRQHHGGRPKGAQQGKQQQPPPMMQQQPQIPPPPGQLHPGQVFSADQFFSMAATMGPPPPSQAK